MQNKDKIKFLDVGCKIGGSLFIAAQYGYKKEDGLGIDIRQQHIDKLISAGYNGMVADATNIPFEDGAFELVIFNHVLEHMNGPEQGKKALSECIRVSSKLIVITLPFFDEDEYLNSIGLKTFYSDWTGHTNKVHFKTLTVDWLVGYNIKTKMIKKLENSLAKEIIPLSAPTDSTEYNSEIHGEKPFIQFDRDIWREYTIIVNK